MADAMVTARMSAGEERGGQPRARTAGHERSQVVNRLYDYVHGE